MNIAGLTKNIISNLRLLSLDLAKTDIETSLLVAKSYGKTLSANYIGILSDSEFELQLGEYFSELLINRRHQADYDILHLMTTGYTSGGHTRVVERFLNGGTGDGIASLDQLPAEIINELPTNIRIFNGIKQPSGVATISTILDIGLKFKRVILHIHPDDILSAIAGILLAKLDVKLFMYNHADHMFSFGYGAAERIFEISKYGWMLGEARGIKHKQSYVGAPITELNIIKNDIHKNNKKIQIFMSGNSNKFKPFGSYSVPDFINQVYQNDFLRDKVKFSICGPTGREYYWKNLKAENLNNIEFLGLQHHKKFIELLSNSDCYIDSFPQGNGTAFVESIMLGIPSFGLNLLAGSSYADLLRSNSTLELINSLIDYINNKDLIKNNLFNIRKNIIIEQSIESCSNRLIISIKKETLSIPDYLMSMNYMPFFHERLWESTEKIIIDYSLMSKLSLNNKLKLIKCWTHILPSNYNSLLTYSARRIKCIFQKLQSHVTA